MAGRPPSRDEIDATLDVLDWLNAVATKPDWRDEISHVAHLLEQETQA